MRITKIQIDKLYALKLVADKAIADYEAELEAVKKAGPNVYKGNCAALVIEEQTRRTIDNKSIFAAYAVPADVIEANTKKITFCRAIFKEVA